MRILGWLIALGFIFFSFSCSRAPVTLSSGEVRGVHKTLIFYSEKSRNAVGAAFFSLKNLTEAVPGKVVVYRPLGTPAVLSGTSGGVSLVVLLVGATLAETSQLRSRLESEALLQAFTPLVSVELSPRGIQSEVVGLPFVIVATEKRHLSFNRFPITVKEELLVSEERDLQSSLPAAAINSNLCLTNDFCDSLRLVGLPDVGLLELFGSHGVYLRSSRKIDNAVFFVVRWIDFKAKKLQF